MTPLTHRYPRADWEMIHAEITDLWNAGSSAPGIARTIHLEYGVCMSVTTARAIAYAGSERRPGRGAPGVKRSNRCAACRPSQRCRACNTRNQRSWRARHQRSDARHA